MITQWQQWRFGAWPNNNELFRVLPDNPLSRRINWQGAREAAVP